MEISPWRTEQGRRARHNQLALLARGDGDLADFARDVLAGRAKPEDLLYRSYLSEKTLHTAHAEIDAWNALPEADRQAAVEEAEGRTRAEIAALAALDLSQPPPDDDDDDDHDFGADFLNSLR
ncbi:hypothetical protein SAMN05421837_102235 [Amycolatopsis pretoriensis]|uniref:Uncharacterized protein n=1 Tax=Amycolatopsis pretoriensis TaxID=218821 RepID=A0A1H5QDR1_9PSEU|nr:hypothetical protein [Amycolatopsis pretoriensis]SEF23538.1 hypothetical protein SAMN05421837_102235 [Amycolatopsis pretoriensis]